MKTKFATWLAAGCLALFLGAGLRAQNSKSDTPSPSPKAWRHLALEHEGKSVTESPDLARKINGLGEEGWQLVDVETFSEAGATTKVVFFFKRPK